MLEPILVVDDSVSAPPWTGTRSRRLADLLPPPGAAAPTAAAAPAARTPPDAPDTPPAAPDTPPAALDAPPAALDAPPAITVPPAPDGEAARDAADAPAPEGTPAAAGAAARWSRPLAALALLAVLVIVITHGGASGEAPPAGAAASIVPGDALVYVNVSLDRGRPAVTQALAVAGRLADYRLVRDGVLTRLGAILGGGRPVDLAEIEPWLGKEAALAVLDTTSSTAGSLIVLAVSHRAQAQAFLHRSGAVAAGSYRGTPLLHYATGTELAFDRDFLLAGQPASVQAALDVAAGATSSLAASPAYRRAAATEPAGRALDGFISLDGVRRVLQPRQGLVGALGDLLYEPALEGVAFSLIPDAGGARIEAHSELDPSLLGLAGAAAPSFAPTLPGVLPATSRVMLDVSDLDRAAPSVLHTLAAIGVGGQIEPLLRRLGPALKAEGVDVASLVSIFGREATLAITAHGGAPALVVVARTSHPAQTEAELASLDLPFAQLFAASGRIGGPTLGFAERTVAGVAAHQLVLHAGLQFDYAVFRGLVVVSTSLQGIADVVEPGATLAGDRSFAATLGDRPATVTSLLFARPAQLLSIGRRIGLTSSAAYARLEPDLAGISAVGMSSSRGRSDTTTQINLRIPAPAGAASAGTPGSGTSALATATSESVGTLSTAAPDALRVRRRTPAPGARRAARGARRRRSARSAAARPRR
ncbi:MAG: DUF3352 domain-containing protein [Solirubrobacteraceae bacterium]|jgi:hypothetical protein